MYAVSAVRLGQLSITTLILTFKVLDGHRGQRRRRKKSGMGEVKVWNTCHRVWRSASSLTVRYHITRATSIHIQTRYKNLLEWIVTNTRK